jgi:alanine dehydrogenase
MLPISTPSSKLSVHMLYFTESDVRDLLPMKDAIGLMQTAFERLAADEAINQPRRRLILPTGSVLHYMAASDGKYFGAKVYSTHAKHGAHFVFLLYRAENAEPLAVLEANYLGQIRTGAVSGLATRYLAPEKAETLAIIGSGFQARSQLAAMLAVRPIRHVKVWSRDAGNRAAFAAESSSKFSASIVPVEQAEWAVREAAIVVTATNAKDPVVESNWIAPGTHINAMGSNQAKRRELPADLIARAALIAVDSVEQARVESGDLMLALDEEGWKNPKIVELKHVVTGAAKARRTPEEITVFKSNGLAVEDVICAGYIYEKGVKEGRGSRSYS